MLEKYLGGISGNDIETQAPAGISVAFCEKEFVAILGASRSGKPLV